MPEFSPALLRGESGSDENQSLWLIMTIALPETNIFAPVNGWLEYDRFLLGWPIFRGHVSFRECKVSKILQPARTGLFFI